MERKNIAAFTEVIGESFPAFVSINRNEDGSRITLTARERGHNGEKQVTLEIPHDDLHQLAVGILYYTDPNAGVVMEVRETDGRVQCVWLGCAMSDFVGRAFIPFPAVPRKVGVEV